LQEGRHSSCAKRPDSFETGLPSRLESTDARLPGPGYSGELALAVDAEEIGVNSLVLIRDASAAWLAPRRGRGRG
jgi:hypothetical protein